MCFQALLAGLPWHLHNVSCVIMHGDGCFEHEQGYCQPPHACVLASCAQPWLIGKQAARVQLQPAMRRWAVMLGGDVWPSTAHSQAAGLHTCSPVAALTLSRLFGCACMLGPRWIYSCQDTLDPHA
jgi:hypothetical protein